MILEVQLFAILREQAGRQRVTLELRDGATVADAMRSISEQHPQLSAAVGSGSIVMAVNRVYAGAEVVLRPGDELALIPPVSGGATAGRPHHARVLEGELSEDRLVRVLRSPHTGAIVTFRGVTREVEMLHYEAYVPMAEERIAEILADACERHGLEGAAAEHRIGSVPLGEASVIVAVAAAHRGPAFAGAREAIDRIKAEAPIWKREVEDGRALWVDGTPPVA